MGGGGAFFTVWTSEKFFKILLLWNHSSDFEIILQDYSLGDPFQKLFAKFWSLEKNMAAMGEGDFLHFTDMKKFLKNLLLWNPWSNFEIISQECSLGDPFQKLFAKFWSVEKPWPPWGGGRLCALYGHEEILKKSSSLKPLFRIWNNFTRLFLVWPFSKTVCEILIHQKTWPPWGVRFWNNFIGLFLGSPFSKILAKFWSVEKHGCHGGGGNFLHYRDMKKFLKTFFSETAGQKLE